MGMFDSILVPCPECGELSEFQTKGGDCLLCIYDLHTAPSDALSDVNRHAPNECSKCGVFFSVKGRSSIIGDPPENEESEVDAAIAVLNKLTLRDRVEVLGRFVR